MALVIGIMSGTSLDGVDAALIDIENSDIKERAFHTYDMPESLKKEILDACSINKSDVAMLCSLNVKLGRFFADCVNNFLSMLSLSYEDILCIGSHGQTVYHQPFEEENFLRSTMQIGEPAEIAYLTRIPVISSFRAKDMAAGGQGAPLVPYPEYLLYSSKVKTRALQNIGGIGNVTLLPKNSSIDDLTAFDTGPGNMIIDSLMRKFYNKKYDKGGECAQKGRIDEQLLLEWMNIPYIKQCPPKSTGRELFGEQFVNRYLELYCDIGPEDFIATATMFTAKSIAENYKEFLFPKQFIDEVIVSGGGSHNKTMLDMLKKLLPEQIILTQEDLGYNSDAKEAVAFAILAYESFNKRFGNAKSATGARENVILGSITWP